MAADELVFYDAFKEAIADGTHDLDDDTFVVLLVDSGYTPSAAHSVIGDVSGDELSGSGYSRYTLTQTWAQSSGVATFDADNATFEADGGSITARYAIIFNDTATGDPLVGYVLLDNTPDDVSVSDGNTLTVQWNASGIFTLATAA